ncbi:glycoside hydrolase family 18 protein [Periconia macrospinosa]|uniref:chitinase n=1 Tax=Periconia macrospinosa TaxID=97972 RepID=A0A2V1EE57_9PLEO|nr:glycoside hydrolase family 18 protein [Periconia macrospinosa]
MKVLLYRFLPHVLLLGSAVKTNDTSSRADWFLYSDAERLAVCNETMLIDMVVQNAEADIEGKVITRACTADYESVIKPAFIAEEEKASLCTTANRVLTNASVYLHQPTASDSEFSNNHLLSAGLQIANHLALQIPSCNHNSMEFAYSQSLAIGLFAGTEVHQHGLTSDVLGKFLEHAQANMISKTTIVQLCGAKGRGADYNIGIVATTAKNLPFVQKAINIWSSGECIPTGANTGEPWMQVTIRTPSLLDEIPGNNTNSTSQRLSNSLANLGRRAHLSVRADCKTAEVQSGDGCSAVASRCGISLSDLEKYNRDNLCNTLVKDEVVCCGSGTLPNTLPPGNSDGTCKTREVVSGDDCTTLPAKCGISSNDFKKANNRGTNFCNNLLEGQQVCCTDGKYPDLKPKPDADGNCATYLTKKDDSCSKIAVARDLNVTDLLDFNRDTWGWNGCKPEVFYPDFLMCVSKGTPPMPAIVPNADCGPTKPDTVKPPSGTNISMLNPCPLNVCCNIWGHCGLSDDFCVVSKSETGAPGTSAPGKNGCVSNCGRDIIKGNAPEKKIKVAYYESWNFNRKCLNMRVTSIPSEYTHIHFAFANVTRGTYKPEITDESTKLEFEDFKKMKNVKKIISFGGWAFSTEPGTFNILREAAQPANRETFKNNLISFMNEHNLDGIDLDWEYPGAPDIPTIPSDDPVNGMNYYRLLSSLKSSVGPDKSVSFAAPASYWYLKAFPIKDMAKALDYIIYMTYDLHGQWDYDNKWTSPGCPTGNCLRSHVNETETKEALSMITKAGADSGKVVVGVASYGRSFKMEQSGCDSEDCKFTGSPRVSNAYKGRCTDTGGYISNAEIQEIISRGNVQKKYTKEGSNILVFNDTEWVAYMDDEMKASRSKFYDEYNFAGTTDWAIDLQRFWDGDDGSDDDDEEEEINDKYWAACEGQYSTIQQLKDRKDSIPGHCMEQYIADVQVAILDGALKKYKSLVDSDYDKKFSIYEKYVKSQIPGQINNFMASDKVDKYFKCTDYKSVGTCCRDCRFGGSCLDGCIKGADCKGGKGDYPMDKCPKMEFPPKALSTDYIPNATFSFTDESGFYKDISDSFGIDKEWISIGKRHMRTNNGCQYAGKDVNECLEKNSNYFRNYPLASGNIKIFNPKDIIGDSYPKANDMLSRFRDMQVAAVWDEEVVASDMVDAMSLPVLSTEEAVASMEKIVEKANEIEKKEREEMILLFITSVLFFIPFVGNAAGAAGLTAVRTIARLIGSVGDAAITIYDIVKNPEGAFLAVFTYVAGAGVGRGGFRNAANSRRSIPTKDIDGMGNVKTKLNDIDGLRGIMCPI